MPNSFWWKQGFYDSPVEGGVEITAQYWQALLNGQSNGYTIIENEEGYPILKAPEPPSPEQLRQNEIDALESRLASTDWMVVKCSELGISMAERYPAEYADRISWRARINELEAME